MRALIPNAINRRWGIETNYRCFKQTLGLDNFSGRGVTAGRQDFNAGQLLKNLALLIQHLLQPVIEQRHKERKLRWKVNFSQGSPVQSGRQCRPCQGPDRLPGSDSGA